MRSALFFQTGAVRTKFLTSLALGLGLSLSFTNNLLPIEIRPWVLTTLFVCLVALFSLAMYWLLPLTWKRLALFSNYTIAVWIALASLVGVFCAVVIPVSFDGGLVTALLPTFIPDSVGQILISVVIGGINIISLTVVILVASVLLITRPAQLTPPVRCSRWLWFYYGLPCIAVWSLWLLVYWPGMMSIDSLIAWEQMLTGRYTDVFPAFHTLNFWVLTRLWFSPAAVAFAQILALAWVIGMALMSFRRLGMSPAGIWAISIILALLPANGALVIALWKDVPYTIAVLALSLLVFNSVISGGDNCKKWYVWLLFGVTAALVALYRHNGFPVAFGSLFLLVLAYPRCRWQLGLSLVLAVGLWLGVRGPLYSAVGVAGSRSSTIEQSLYPLVQQVAAHLASETYLTNEEKSGLNYIKPLNPDWDYDCYSIRTTIYSGDFNSQQLLAHSKEFTQLYLDLLLRRPQVNLAHLACAASYVWRITYPPGSYYGTVYIWTDEPGGIVAIKGEEHTVPAERLNLSSQSLLPEFLEPLTAWTFKSQMSEVSWLFWRSAFALYLGIFSAVVASLRSRNWRYLLIMVPGFINSLIMGLLSPSQDFRYVYPVYVVSLLFSGFLLFGVERDSEVEP